MSSSVETAKRLMETRVIAMIAENKEVGEKEAMRMFYESVTYKWFADDSTGVAREGADAVFCRVISELDGNIIC
ncbi:MAG: hypothetical protein FWD44_03045 [Oscillospiraceae bacterium]|nr:hypothetical protein [Oscillospiraceae bacterium]